MTRSTSRRNVVVAAILTACSAVAVIAASIVGLPSISFQLSGGPSATMEASTPTATKVELNIPDLNKKLDDLAVETSPGYGTKAESTTGFSNCVSFDDENCTIPADCDDKFANPCEIPLGDGTCTQFGHPCNETITSEECEFKDCPGETPLSDKTADDTVPRPTTINSDPAYNNGSCANDYTPSWTLLCSIGDDHLVSLTLGQLEDTLSLTHAGIRTFANFSHNGATYSSVDPSAVTGESFVGPLPGNCFTPFSEYEYAVSATDCHVSQIPGWGIVKITDSSTDYGVHVLIQLPDGRTYELDGRSGGLRADGPYNKYADVTTGD